MRARHAGAAPALTLTLTLLVSTAPLGAQTAAPPLPAPETFFQRPALLEARLSPSGRRVALTTSRGIPRIGLVVIELGAQPVAKAVAAFRDADITAFQWAGDDRLIFNVRDLDAGSGEDRYVAPGLYAVDADGGALRELVQRHGTPRVVDGSVRDRPLERHHVLLHVPTPQPGVAPDAVIVGELDVVAGQVRAVWPKWLDTRSGRTRPLQDLDAPPDVMEWRFDSRGQPRVAVARAGGRIRVHWRGPGDAAWRQLSDEAALRQRWAPHSVDDDGTFYVTQPSGADGTRVLTRWDFAANAPRAEPMVVTPGFDFRGGLVRGDSGRTLGVRVETDAESTVWLAPPMKRAQELLDAQLPGRVNRIECRRCGEPDMVALVRSYADNDPGRLWLFEAAGPRLRAISTVLDGVDPERMASVDFQRIKARDGADLPLWLTRPAGVPRKQPLPAVVLVHGGPWLRGGQWRWEPMAQFIASRGYLVIAPEFRGSTGYGARHYRAGWKQWGRAMQDDVADTLRWARTQGLADPQRACIAGASYGGYSALMGLVRDPELYRCGVAWMAVTDPFLLLEGSWWVDDDASDDSRRHTLPELIGDAKADVALLTAASPLAQAARIKAPVLLAYGDADRRVPITHGKRLRDALEAAGNPPEWVSYANEGHGWRQLSTNVDFARRLEQFLARHLRDAPAPR